MKADSLTIFFIIFSIGIGWIAHALWFVPAEPLYYVEVTPHRVIWADDGPVCRE